MTHSLKFWLALTVVFIPLANTIELAFAEESSVVQGNPFPITINHGIADNKLSVYVDGIDLAAVKHFTFNGEVIDDYLQNSVNQGLATIEQHPGSFTISISLPEQKMMGGVLGIVLANDITISSEIPSDLFTQDDRQTRGASLSKVVIKGTVYYRLPNCWFLNC